MSLTLKQARRMVAKSRRRVWRVARGAELPMPEPGLGDHGRTAHAVWLAEMFIGPPLSIVMRHRFDALRRLEVQYGERAWARLVQARSRELPALDHGQDGDELLQDVADYYASGQSCAVCGAEMDWIECDHCSGEGGYDNDALMEVDPLWYDGVEWEDCGNCQGKGGWWQCYRAPHGGGDE